MSLGIVFAADSRITIKSNDSEDLVNMFFGANKVDASFAYLKMQLLKILCH